MYWGEERRRMSKVEIVVGMGVLYTSMRVIITRSAVTSVIYLVGTIINGGIIFMKLGINIIPLIYIIVYVGGISILFLFVIMMVDMNKGESGWEVGGMRLMREVGVIMGTIVIYGGVVGERGMGEGKVCVEMGYRGMRWEGSIKTMEMIKGIGYVLYSENIMALIVIGFVLLMVMMSLRLLLKTE